MTTFGIQSLLTNTDGSAGRDKSDVRPVPDLATHLSATEWNNVKRAVVELQAVLGTAVNPGADSLAALLLGMSSGPRSNGWVIAEDFLLTRSEATVSTAGAGASATLAAADAVGEGAGLLVLQHGGAAGTVRWTPQSADSIVSTCNPRCRMRFRAPSNFANSDCRIGIGDVGAGSYAFIGWDHTTQVKLFCESQNGAGTANKNLFTGVAGAWYELEIRIVDGVSAGVYDASGALIDQVTTTTAVPQGGDQLSPFHAYLQRFASADEIAVDWFVATGGRL